MNPSLCHLRHVLPSLGVALLACETIPALPFPEGMEDPAITKDAGPLRDRAPRQGMANGASAGPVAGSLDAGSLDAGSLDAGSLDAELAPGFGPFGDPTSAEWDASHGSVESHARTCAPGFHMEGSDCVSDCDGGLCGEPQACAGDQDCGPSLLAALADVCAQDRECASGHCVDQVCCEVDACGVCETCAGQGTAGTCHEVFGAPDVDSCTGQRACGRNRACLSIDQDNIVRDTRITPLRGDQEGQYVAQTFKVGTSGVLAEIHLLGYCSASLGQIGSIMEADDDGVPTGTVVSFLSGIQGNHPVPLELSGPSEHPDVFPLERPASVNAGERFAIVLPMLVDSDLDQLCALQVATRDSYADGQMLISSDGGRSWELPFADNTEFRQEADIAFRTMLE